MTQEYEKAGKSRRQFFTSLAGVGALGVVPLVGLGWVSDTHAQSSQRYKLIEPAMPTQDKSKVEVMEFFWFGCPHCYRFEPSINAWNESKPDYVNFVREAPPLNASWEQHSRAFYAAQALGIADGMFDSMFDHIHQKKKSMRNPKKIAQFIESLDLGVGAAEFIEAMDSFTVNTAIQRSMGRAQQAGISSVPSVVINGKYLTTSTLAGSNENVIDLINELSAKEHQAT